MAICRVYWAKPNLGILSLYSVHLLPGLLIAKKLLKSLWFSPLPQPTPYPTTTTNGNLQLSRISTYV